MSVSLNSLTSSLRLAAAPPGSRPVWEVDKHSPGTAPAGPGPRRVTGPRTQAGWSPPRAQDGPRSAGPARSAGPGARTALEEHGLAGGSALVLRRGRAGCRRRPTIGHLKTLQNFVSLKVMMFSFPNFPASARLSALFGSTRSGPGGVWASTCRSSHAWRPSKRLPVRNYFSTTVGPNEGGRVSFCFARASFARRRTYRPYIAEDKGGSGEKTQL